MQPLLNTDTRDWEWTVEGWRFHEPYVQRADNYWDALSKANAALRSGTLDPYTGVRIIEGNHVIKSFLEPIVGGE